LTGCGAGASGGAQAMAGQSCANGKDSNHICLAMNWVAYTDSSGKPTVTPDQAAGIVAGMNKIWAQCDIGFQVENYSTVDPTTKGLAYGAASQAQTDQIRN